MSQPMFDITLESGWRAAPPEPRAWLQSYAVRRYGGSSPAMAAATDVLYDAAMACLHTQVKVFVRRADAPEYSAAALLVTAQAAWQTPRRWPFAGCASPLPAAMFCPQIAPR